MSNLEGEQVDLSAHLGRDVIVLDFWASWCPPCRRALPMVAGIARDFADRGVAVYAVNKGEPEATARAYIAKNKLDLPVLLDVAKNASALYGVSGIPQIVLIGRDGVAAKVHVGLAPNEDRTLRAELEELLNPPAPDGA